MTSPKTYMLTIKYHPTDIDLFEDTIAYFKNTCFGYAALYKKSLYGIEMDGTPDRHLHYIFEDEVSRDIQAVQRAIKKTFKTQIKKIKEGKLSTKFDDKLINCSFNLVKRKPDALYYENGYPLKSDPIRYNYTGYSLMEIEEFKINMKNHLILKNTNLKYIDKFHHLTIKTAIPAVFAYMRKYKDKVKFTKYGTNLQDLMENDNYVFIELNKDKIQYIRNYVRRHFYSDMIDSVSTFHDDATQLDEVPKYELLNEIEFLKNRIQELESENLSFLMKQK